MYYFAATFKALRLVDRLGTSNIDVCVGCSAIRHTLEAHEEMRSRVRAVGAACLDAR